MENRPPNSLKMIRENVFKGMQIGFGICLSVTLTWSIATYATLSTGLSIADRTFAGSGLTATAWNKLVDSIVELDTRTSGMNISIFSAYETDNVARTYSWQMIFNTAKSSGKVVSGGIYDCLVWTNNPGHWKARRFTAEVNVYDDHHRINNFVDVDSGYTSGCSAGGLSAVDGNGFTYQFGDCNQGVYVRCSKLN